MFILVSSHNRAAKFAGSLGMVGSLDGTWLARDGVTVIGNANDLADEWQVKSMTSLFHDLDGPQYPNACELPASQHGRRRGLRGGGGAVMDADYTAAQVVTEEEDAKKACSRTGDRSDFEACVSDVLNSGALELASHYD